MARNNKIIALNRKPDLYIKYAGKKGRGVFCATDIRKGEILEVTPALILDSKETDFVDKTALLNYTFSVDKISKAALKQAGIKSNKGTSAVVMGMTSFCNHGTPEEQNADVSWQEDSGTVYYVLTAIKKIPRNTEICTSYGEGWFEERQ